MLYLTAISQSQLARAQELDPRDISSSPTTMGFIYHHKGHPHDAMVHVVVIVRRLMVPNQLLVSLQLLNLVGTPEAAMFLIWVISKPEFWRRRRKMSWRS